MPLRRACCIATAWNFASGVPGGRAARRAPPAAGAAGAARRRASGRPAAEQPRAQRPTRLLSKSDSVGREAGDEGAPAARRRTAGARTTGWSTPPFVGGRA